MKKIPLLITIGIIVLLTGGYYLYEKVLRAKPLQPWDLVPRDAVLVYEKDACKTCIENVSQSSAWSIIEAATQYSKPQDTLHTALQDLIQAHAGLLVSLHATRKDDFDFVFYARATDGKFTQLSALTSDPRRYRHAEREFNSVRIHEIRFSKQVFSWTMLENVWVGSFTPFLIEDVIRTFKSKTDFRKSWGNTLQLSQIRDDAGNLYIDLNNFSSWLSVFSPDLAKTTHAFGRFSALDIKTDDNTITLSGFSADSVDKSAYVLSVFRNQSPVPFELKHVISSRTLALNSYGITHGKLFYQDLQAFAQKHNPQVTDSLKRIAASAGIQFSELFNTIDDEVGVCFLESSKGIRMTKVLMVKTNKAPVWLQAFDKLAQKFSTDTIFYEQYAGYEIREVPLHHFPEKMFWPLVTGFSQSFYTSVGNTVIIGENLEELKRFLNDIDEEDTWGKSVAFNKFLKSTLLESNLSIYVNTPRVWNLLLPKLQPRWKQFVTEKQTMLRALQNGAIQFSHLNNNYYTNVSWSYRPVSKTAEPSNRERFVTHFNSGIQRLHAVKSHVNRNDEMLVQDSLNDLSLVSNEGKVLWKIAVGDGIRSEIHQVDFFANGKLQYFFATRDALHVIDRLGNYVEPFPLHLPAMEIEQVSVIDYDHSKKYRFLVADTKGRLWMYDKEGNNLEGWNSKDAGAPLLLPPAHHRIKGKDYIIAFQQDGKVLLMSRRGETLKGFPLDLEGKIAGNYFLDIGSSTSDTYFIVITRDGFRIKFNVEGKIQSRETLLKTAFNTSFALISERASKSYLIVQQDGRQFNILDDAGKKILSNEFIGGNKVNVNFSDFGAGKNYIAVTDLVQALTYVYDERGNLLTVPPLESSLIEIRPIDSDRASVFFANGNTLTIQPL